MGPRPANNAKQFSKKYCSWLCLWADQDIHKSIFQLECQYSSRRHNFQTWWNGLKYCITTLTTSRMEHDFSINKKKFSNPSAKTKYAFSKLLSWKTFWLIFTFAIIYVMCVCVFIFWRCVCVYVGLSVTPISQNPT